MSHGKKSGMARLTKEIHSPFRLLVIVIVSIFVAEGSVMYILHTLLTLSAQEEGLLDSFLLSVIIFPVLYLSLFRPMALHITRYKQAQEKLQEAHDELEVRVADRTAELTATNKALEHEINERKRTEAELNFLLKVTLAVSEAEDLHSALYTVLRKVCDATGWVLGEVWLPRTDGTCLECSPVWYSCAEGLEKFRKVCEASSVPPGVGLPGRVWSSKRPAWIYDVTVDTNFPRAPLAREVGLGAAVGIPILAGDEVLAVMDFFLLEPREEDERCVYLFSAVAAEVGSMIQRKRAEEMLRESEERFRTVAQSAVNAIILADGDGNIIVWNKSAHTIFGYSEEEVLGKSLTLLMPERFREAHRQGMERYRSTGEARVVGKTIEIQGLRKDGSEFPVELSLSTWKKGNDIFYSGIIRDITERKRAEMEYKTILSSSMDGFWVADVHGRFLDVNDAYSRLVGYSREELLTMSILDVEVVEKPDETTAHIQRILSVGYDRFETRHRCKDGRVVDVEVSVNYLDVEDGRFFVFLRDISERKQAEKEREKLLHELEDALANVKTLGGLIPICASCKKIRNDQGYWTQVEHYITERSDATFSHGICPECLVKLYPKYAEQVNKKN